MILIFCLFVHLVCLFNKFVTIISFNFKRRVEDEEEMRCCNLHALTSSHPSLKNPRKYIAPQFFRLFDNP